MFNFIQVMRHHLKEFSAVMSLTGLYKLAYLSIMLQCAFFFQRWFVYLSFVSK